MDYRTILLAAMLVLIQISHSKGAVPPYFIDDGADEVFVFEVDESGNETNLTLTCEALGEPTPTIAWFYDGNPVNGSMLQENGTFLVVNITEGEFASAEGTNYYCTATNIHGTIRSRNITVYYASFGGFVNDSTEPTSTTVNVTEDGDVALLCDVEPSFPQPVIEWYANGTMIDPGDDTDNKYYRDGGRYLVILDLTPIDITASYRCAINNAWIHETVMSNTSYVLSEVSEFPEGLFFYKSLENKTGLVGDRVEFSLVVGYGGTGNLIYSFEDIKDADGLVSVPSSTLSTTVNNEGLADIEEIPDNEVEIYIVEASVGVLGEELGEAQTVTLSVQARATITSSPDNALNQFTMDTIVFTCETSGRPQPSIEFYFNGEPLMADGSRVVVDGNNLTINGSIINDTGMYQCFVRNEINTVQESWALRVREPEPPAIVTIQGFNGTEVSEDCRVPQAVLSETPGESVTIEIVVTADPCPSITWMYNGTKIEFANNTIYNVSDDPCPPDQEEFSSFNFSLTVSDIMEGEGLYIALFENRAGNVTSDEVLVVAEANAAVTSLTLLNESCLLGNETLRLKCETSGYPEPEITFFKGRRMIDVSGNMRTSQDCDELVIADVQPEDAGIYRCSANNGGGNTARMEFTAVYCTLPNAVSLVSDNISPAEGDSVVLTCTTSGTPAPQVLWQRVDGDVVDNITDTLRIRVSGSHPQFQLQINDIEPDDEGVYRCLASNVAGEDFEDLSVEVEDDDEDDLSTEAIAGIVSGTVLGVLIILVVIVLVVVIVMVIQGKRSSKEGKVVVQEEPQTALTKEDEAYQTTVGTHSEKEQGYYA